MAAPNYRIEYVSGSIGVAREGASQRGTIVFPIYNRGSRDEHSACEVVKWGYGVIWRSDENISLIRPGEATVFQFFADEFDGARYWGQIYATSENLVPSLEVLVYPDRGTFEHTMFAYFSPCDFKRFTLG